MRKIITSIKRSNVMHEFLKTKSNNLCIILDCETRWSSLFTALDRFINIKPAIKKTLYKFKKSKLLKDLKMEVLIELKNSLVYFKTATEILSSDDCTFVKGINVFFG